MKGLIALMLSATLCCCLVSPAYSQATASGSGDSFVLELDDVMLAELGRRNGLKSMLPKLQGRNFTQVLLKYVGNNGKRTTPKPQVFDTATESNVNPSGLNSFVLPIDSSAIQQLKSGEVLGASIDPKKDIGLIKIVMDPKSQPSNVSTNNSGQFGGASVPPVTSASNRTPTLPTNPPPVSTQPKVANDPFSTGDNSFGGNQNWNQRNSSKATTQPINRQNPLPANPNNVLSNNNLYPSVNSSVGGQGQGLVPRNNVGGNSVPRSGNPTGNVPPITRQPVSPNVNPVAPGYGQRADYTNPRRANPEYRQGINPLVDPRRQGDRNYVPQSRQDPPRYVQRFDQDRYPRVSDREMAEYWNRRRVRDDRLEEDRRGGSDSEINTMRKELLDMKMQLAMRDKSVAAPPKRTSETTNKTDASKKETEEVPPSRGSWVFSPMLWFMFLVSFGLNLYLWWIWRSSFTRYQELADDLRQSFSQPIS